MNTTTTKSHTMKRNGKLLMLAAAISLTLVAQYTDDAVIGQSTAIAVNTATISDPAPTQQSSLDVRLLPENTVEATVAQPYESLSATSYASAPVDTSAATAVYGPTKETSDAPVDGSDPSEQSASRPRDKMSGPVAALFDSGATGDAELVVRYDERPQLFDDEYVAQLGGEVIRSYENFDMRAIRLPVAALESLAMDENVDWLSLDDDMSATSLSSRQAVNQPLAGTMNAGYAGSSVGVAVLDTGIALHADLSDNIVQYSFLKGAFPIPQFANGQVVPTSIDAREDGFGHGTHVAGILSGSGVESNDEFKGSATGASIVSLQVLDKNGKGSTSSVLAALDWIYTFGSFYNIRVVNMSLGKGVSESIETDPLIAAVERLWDAGFVVVAAAGNEGFAGSMTITSPGNSRKVITVGSLTDNATGTDYSDDYVSSFSSRGPSVGDYVLKPDILAPGNRLVGAADKKSKLASLLGGRLKNCKKSGCSGETVYLELSGTSMATPVVSAAAALMLDKDPSLSPATVKARLMRSARKLEADPTEAGAGLLDIDAALNDSGVVYGQALSPLMTLDRQTDAVLVESTAVLWGNEAWGTAYLYSGALNWSSGASYTDANGVTANGYMWTGGGMEAKGYMWTDGMEAKGYMWTDGTEAKTLLDGTDESGLFLNDDAPGQ